MELKNRRENLTNQDTILQIGAMLVINCIVYWGTPFWTNGFYHYSMVTEFDNLIPFKSIFVIPYILAYVQWAVGYVRIACTDRIYSSKILYGAIISKLITGVIFILIPTTMERAVIDSEGICSALVKYIYKIDSATNLFPSIHCLDSWICLRASINKEYFSHRYTVFMGVATLLVILSTVFIKQHVVADAVGAILVAEIGLYMGREVIVPKELNRL